MKKLLILTCLLILASTGVNATENVKVQQPANAQEIQKSREIIKAQRDAAFERRLGLTELQKLKARQIRQKGHEALKPVMEEIKAKKQEAEMIRRSRMAVRMQEEKLTEIDAELAVLEKKANEIRKANMKEFESILTKQQKKILKDMKKEGRDRYRAAHPMMPPVPPCHHQQ